MEAQSNKRAGPNLYSRIDFSAHEAIQSSLLLIKTLDLKYSCGGENER
jgi:hypothetical protein